MTGISLPGSLISLFSHQANAMNNNELIGLTAAFLASLSFGSYGVPMKGEAATSLDVDPLVFQSYKSFSVLVTSAILIAVNNLLADQYDAATRWTFSDFTPWAFVSSVLWVPGGTAGVYAIRRAGLAISVGIWSCVIVMLSFVWGVLIFHEKQRSGVWGALGAMGVLCFGLCGIAYFSSFEAESKKRKRLEGHRTNNDEEQVARETSPLIEIQQQTQQYTEEDSTRSLDLETFPHSGAPPHSHQTINIHLPAFLFEDNNARKHTLNFLKYHIGLFMAVVNGVLAASIMVPLHYAPPKSTQGIGFSMSFGIAAMIVVVAIWILRWMLHSVQHCIEDSRWNGCCSLQTATQIITESFCKGYNSLPSFYLKQMWRPGLLSGLLYSLGNLFGIVSIQRLGNFMGYSLNQSSMIVSGELSCVALFPWLTYSFAHMPPSFVVVRTMGYILLQGDPRHS